MDDLFDGDFVANFPLWIIVDREKAKTSPTQAVQFWTDDDKKVMFMPVFTDHDLALRFLEVENVGGSEAIPIPGRFEFLAIVAQLVEAKKALIGLDFDAKTKRGRFIPAREFFQALL